MMSQAEYAPSFAHLNNLFAVQVQQESGLLGPEPTTEEYEEAFSIYNMIMDDSEKAGMYIPEDTKVKPSRYSALEQQLSIQSRPTPPKPFRAFYSVLHEYCPTKIGQINVVHLILNSVFGVTPSVDENSKYIPPSTPPKVLPLPDILPIARRWPTYDNTHRDYTYLVLRHICEDFLTCFFVPLKMEGGTTRVPSNWTSGVNSQPSINDSEQGVKQRLSGLRDKCLKRDGYKCVITEEYDSSYVTDAVKEKLGVESTISTEVAHIIPHGLNDLEKSSLTISDNAHYIWRIINMLDPGLSDTLKGKNIDTVNNCMTLAREIHSAFGKLAYYFDEIEDQPNSYFFRHAGGKAQKLPWYFTPKHAITFLDHSNSSPTMALPSPRLLRFHRACCLILHLSGMAEYVERLIDEMEDLMCQDVLSADGSSNLALLLTSKGNLTPPLVDDDDGDDEDDVEVDYFGEENVVLGNQVGVAAEKAPDTHTSPFWGILKH